MSNLDFAIGFIAGEGSFTLSMNVARGKRYPRVRCVVTIHKKDLDALYECQEAFDGIGTISHKKGHGTVQWVVRSKEDIEHLRDKIKENAPSAWYKTEKHRNFEVWSDILDIHIDGRTNPTEAIEMAKLARDGLNIDNGITEEKWNEYIAHLEERRNG